MTCCLQKVDKIKTIKMLNFISQKLIGTTKTIISCQNPSEKVLFEWSDPMILSVHRVTSLIELYRRPVSSVGRAPVCRQEVVGSNPAAPTTRVLKTTGEIMLVVI